MAIAKTFARAPCPIFAGRGVENGGFTIQMPYKTYLTCEKTNIASERSLLTVFNYDIAEYVYNQAADAYAFGVYVETGGFTDAITDGKHIYAAKLFLKLSEDYSLGSGERHNCDVRALSVGLEVAYDLSGVAHGAYISVQFKEAGDATTIGGYYLSHTPTYGVIGLEVRTECKDGGDGGVVVGAAAFGIVGLLIAQKNDAQPTGNYAGIVIHVPYEGSDTFVGTSYGIRFDTGGLWAGTDFDYGIDFGDQCLVGIDIGACNTGIVFTGTIATAGITMAAGVTCPILMNVGTSSADGGVHWDMAANLVMIAGEANDTTPASTTMVKCVLHSFDGASASGRLECLRGEVITTSGDNQAAGIRAVVGQITFTGAVTYTGGPAGQGAYPLVGSVYSSGAVTLTNSTDTIACAGLFWGLAANSDVTGGWSAFIYCYKFGTGDAPESIIHLENDDPTRPIDFFFDSPQIDDGLASNPQMFDNTAINTTSNQSDGRMKIRIGGTTFYIPIYQ